LNDDLLFRRHPRNVSLLIVVFPQKWSFPAWLKYINHTQTLRLSFQ
jgi:hypothetical protein